MVAETANEYEIIDGDTILCPVGRARNEETGQPLPIELSFTGVEYRCNGCRHLEIHTGHLVKTRPEQYTAKRALRVADYRVTVDKDSITLWYYVMPETLSVTQRWHDTGDGWVYETWSETDVSQSSVEGKPVHYERPLLPVTREHLQAGGEGNE